MKNWKDLKDEEIVCYCSNIDKKTIVTAIKNGSNSLVKIQEVTTACIGNDCKNLNPSGKCCSSDILELIKIYSDKPTDDSSCCSCGCGY